MARLYFLTTCDTSNLCKHCFLLCWKFSFKDFSFWHVNYHCRMEDEEHEEEEQQEEEEVEEQEEHRYILLENKYEKKHRGQKLFYGKV